MQVGGVGSGYDTYSHQVTSCLHEQGADNKAGSKEAKAGAAQTAQTVTEALQENSTGNLLSRVQNIGSKGKGLLQKIWGDSKEAGDVIPFNPFQEVRHQVQKAARKLMDRLSGRFLGSHNGDFLQTKQQHTKEDLRKRSQYKADDQEMECILTDESYLTDSYNRKGEYSHLTTNK